MVRLIQFLVLVLSYFTLPLIADDEDCTPSFVRTLSASDEYILSWTPAEDDCPISYYIISILSRGVETVYTSEETSMDVSFLPTCESVTFSVVPVSTNNITGSFRSLGMRMPVRSEANVTIDHIRISQESERSFLLIWELEEEWKECTNRFRVVIHNDDYDDTVDLYVETNSTLLDHILPCEDYTFTVRAIHSLTKEGPISLIRYTTPSARIAAPALQSIKAGTTSVDLEWQLESYTHNRCAVSSIVVDGSPYFQAAYPVRDDPERPILSTNVTDLQTDTMYFFNVSVINTAGPSVPFLVAVQTLEDS